MRGSTKPSDDNLEMDAGLLGKVKCDGGDISVIIIVIIHKFN